MNTKEQIISGQVSTNSHQPLNPQDKHTQNLYKTIDAFYDFSEVSDFMEFHNALLNFYLDNRGEDHFLHSTDVVFMVLFQNKFLVSLKEKWEVFKKLENPEIESY